MRKPPDGILRLRSAGLKVTAPRIAVLEAVEATAPHPFVDQITEAARRSLGNISTKTVYENLRVLAEAGLVRRFEPAGSSARYELSGEPHHHIVCRACGDFEDVDCAATDGVCLELSSIKGYGAVEAEVIFWGICPKCLSERSQAESH